MYEPIAPTPNYGISRRQVSDASFGTEIGACTDLKHLRKEVIQPQVLLRLPCYDFTPITNPSLVTSLLAVGSATSGEVDSRGVTGGVYKARERIHRAVADARLLAIPPSCSRVADYNPN